MGKLEGLEEVLKLLAKFEYVFDTNIKKVKRLEPIAYKIKELDPALWQITNDSRRILSKLMTMGLKRKRKNPHKVSNEYWAMIKNISGIYREIIEMVGKSEHVTIDDEDDAIEYLVELLETSIGWVSTKKSKASRPIQQVTDEEGLPHNRRVFLWMAGDVTTIEGTALPAHIALAIEYGYLPIAPQTWLYLHTVYSDGLKRNRAKRYCEEYLLDADCAYFIGEDYTVKKFKEICQEVGIEILEEL